MSWLFFERKESLRCPLLLFYTRGRCTGRCKRRKTFSFFWVYFSFPASASLTTKASEYTSSFFFLIFTTRLTFLSWTESSFFLGWWTWQTIHVLWWPTFFCLMIFYENHLKREQRVEWMVMNRSTRIIKIKKDYHTLTTTDKTFAGQIRTCTWWSYDWNLHEIPGQRNK